MAFTEGLFKIQPASPAYNTIRADKQLTNYIGKACKTAARIWDLAWEVQSSDPISRSIADLTFFGYNYFHRTFLQFLFFFFSFLA